jgi:hypothetical protein
MTWEMEQQYSQVCLWGRFCRRLAFEIVDWVKKILSHPWGSATSNTLRTQCAEDHIEQEKLMWSWDSHFLLLLDVVSQAFSSQDLLRLSPLPQQFSGLWPHTGSYTISSLSSLREFKYGLITPLAFWFSSLQTGYMGL